MTSPGDRTSKITVNFMTAEQMQLTSSHTCKQAPCPSTAEATAFFLCLLPYRPPLLLNTHHKSL